MTSAPRLPSFSSLAPTNAVATRCYSARRAWSTRSADRRTSALLLVCPNLGLQSTQLDLGGATLDLGGGVFLISSPVVFPAVGARNFQVRGGTLRAARSFPAAGYFLHLLEPCPTHL